MLRQRNLRDRLVAMTALPLVAAVVAGAGLVALADGDNGRTLGFGVIATAALAALLAGVIGRTILRALTELADAASAAAEAQRQVATGELAVDELSPIGTAGGPGELGRIAGAIDAISQAGIEAAETQRQTIRQGLATIVINLARRNQSLLDRQVGYLDGLEQGEEDPDRLAELFRVDHLATRMRRNAESLLVLAGAEPGKRRGKPVTISDVLRVAIGEVENYQRIELGAIDEGEVPATVAVDLAHLTAELMENATQFSPPSAPVEVSALRDGTDGAYRISIVDQGMGLGDRLASANQTLVDPPQLGLGMGRSLGFMVVGRLAQRLRAEVELEANPGGGTIAQVRLPLTALHQAASTPPAATDTATEPTPAAPAPAAPAGPAVASTTLEKLLGISGTAEEPADAASGVAQPDDWRQHAPFADRGARPGSAPIPPPGPESTWSSLTNDEPAEPAAPAAAWTPPAAPPRLDGAEVADPWSTAGASDAPDPRPPGHEVADAWPAVAPEPGPIDPAEPPRPSSQPLAAVDPWGRGQPGQDHEPATGWPAATDPSTPDRSWPAPPVDPQLPSSDGPWGSVPPSPDPWPGGGHEPSWLDPSDPTADAIATSQPAEANPRHPSTRPPSESAPPFDAASWPPPTAPEPGRPVGLAPPARFDEAVPSGADFENGVASLLAPPPSSASPPVPPPRGDGSSSGLERRQRGASNVPIGEGRPVAAPSRSPEEVRSMLSRYRDGLRDGRRGPDQNGPETDQPDDRSR